PSSLGPLAGPRTRGIPPPCRPLGRSRLPLLLTRSAQGERASARERRPEAREPERLTPLESDHDPRHGNRRRERAWPRNGPALRLPNRDAQGPGQGPDLVPLDTT